MASDQQLIDGSNKTGSGSARSTHRKKVCSGYCVYKFLVTIYGLLFFVIGLLLLGLGIWVVTASQHYESINDAPMSPAILAIVVGVCMLLTAFCGIIGALKDKLLLLKIFLGVIILVFILQVIIGIIAFIYREQTAAVAEKQLRFAMREYTNSKATARAIDTIQSQFSCCGLQNPFDWNINPDFSCYSTSEFACGVPVSCCSSSEPKPCSVLKICSAKAICGRGVRKGLAGKELSERLRILRRRKINTRGCSWFFKMWVENHLDMVGATALGFAILHILGIFIVYVLITKVHDHKLLYRYRKRVYEQ
ncbi:Tetraspanin-15 [Lamellibrachia satsuma]|nr:Tetraspanin-15 [Lamellibrachia satsuma]